MDMNARLSVSTIAYLAEQEKIAEREKIEELQLRAKLERERKEQMERVKKRDELTYDELIVQEICERVSCGGLLIEICNDEHLPTVRRFYQWLRENSDINALYKDSINDRLNIFEEQIIQIADDAAADFKEVVRHGRTVRVLDGEAIARAKLRVEVRFRHLKAGRPQKWGDSTTLNVKSDDPNSVANLSAEELEKRLADLDTKNSVFRSAA
jgi:hypothetical protein